MADSVIARGKSIKEAVSAALELLNADRRSVDIEVVSSESRGWFGIGTKPAVVKVTLKERGRPQDESNGGHALTIEALAREAERLLADESYVEQPADESDQRDGSFVQESAGREGKAWVQDGIVRVKDAPDRYPLLAAEKGMSVFVNDELVTGPVVVREADTVSVVLDNETKEPEWEIKLSDDNMEAYLRYSPGCRITRRLRDRQPASLLRLEAVETVSPILLDTRLILAELNRMNITHGVDLTEIVRACTNDEECSVVIARGTPPKPGSNGRFLPYLDSEVRKGVKERDNGSVDHRELHEFPSVEEGQTIGTALPPEPGAAGMTVTGEHVPPLDVHPIRIVAGDGALILDDGTKAVATTIGLPEIKVRGLLAHVSVIPVLKIERDVDLFIGNIRYHGDVQVAGSVQDGMLVRVQGNVTVRHNIHAAKVVAGKSVLVHGNIIGGTVNAGQRQLLHAQLDRGMSELVPLIKQLRQAILQLSKVAALKSTSFTQMGLSALIKILLEGKFKSIVPILGVMTERIRGGAEELDGIWMTYREFLLKGFSVTYPSNLQSIEDLERLIVLSEELHATLVDESIAEECNITASHVHYGTLYASGNIFIVGNGSYQSSIHAEDSVKIAGNVRGGHIYGTKSVILESAGSDGGIITLIDVSAAGAIRVLAANENTIIRVGNRVHRILMPTRNLHARLDEKGELLLH